MRNHGLCGRDTALSFSKNAVYELTRAGREGNPRCHTLCGRGKRGVSKMVPHVGGEAGSIWSHMGRAKGENVGGARGEFKKQRPIWTEEVIELREICHIWVHVRGRKG